MQLAASCQSKILADVVEQRCTATPSDGPVGSLLELAVLDLCNACMVETSCRQPHHCALLSIMLRKLNPGSEGAVEHAADETGDDLYLISIGVKPRTAARTSKTST